jgi:hypothetical protein
MDVVVGAPRSACADQRPPPLAEAEVCMDGLANMCKLRLADPWVQRKREAFARERLSDREVARAIAEAPVRRG